MGDKKKRSERLRVIAELADRKVNAAAQALAKTNAHLARQKYSERLLADAREQHIEHIDGALDSGSAAYHLKVLNQSVRNLDRGLHQVADRISAVEGEREARKMDWANNRARREAIDRVVQRRSQDEALEEQHNAEKVVDDSVAHSYHQKTT